MGKRGFGDSYRFAVQSFFEPTDFLRTLRDWILSTSNHGKLFKALLTAYVPDWREHDLRRRRSLSARP